MVNTRIVPRHIPSHPHPYPQPIPNRLTSSTVIHAYLPNPAGPWIRSAYAALTLLLLPLLPGCSDGAAATTQPAKPYGEPTIDTQQVAADFMIWWTYFSDSIILSDDFIALDTSLQELSKEAFLEELTTGEYVPVKLAAYDGHTYLQLHALSPQSDERIATTIRNQALTALG